MGMTQLSIALPETLQEYVDRRVSHGEFGTPGDFVRTLIRRDKEARVAALEAEMLEALDGTRVSLSHEEVTGGNLVSILKAKSGRGR